jgi:hypothetical protein
MQTNSDPMLRAPSIQNMSMENSLAGPLQHAVQNKARQLGHSILTSSQNNRVVAFCNAIEQSHPAVPVALRQKFADYLAKENIHGLDSMPPSHRKLCAWVLLERVARDDTPLNPTKPDQIRSFIRNEVDRRAIEQIPKLLQLDPRPYFA